MAQIEQSDNGGKKKKGAQKKMQIHVDFTPMVDMNMLLITFFMLCTTMIKSQTLNIALPSNEKVEQEQQNKAKESQAVTLILDTERDEEGKVKFDPETGKPAHIIYYYMGKPETADEDKDGRIDNSNLKVEKFLGNESNGETRGIRKILHDKNKTVLEKIAVLKDKWKAKEITDEQYQAQAKEIRNDSTIADRPVVIIKASPNASWESLIGALDEMQINQISRYQIDNINAVDSLLIFDYIGKTRN
ncbi:biopolymer transporter ExbD [uncultured Muribaculum sp.]|uniref:ExbD/TolR family protein n=1 Tax=uncultured Muribaculum sp. TaxID=1918613 RepID=UPI00266FC8F2|nr:biopolymer transporter ExbD [uncultured Muribaculum sp.]